jgi:hypothetical protein
MRWFGRRKSSIKKLAIQPPAPFPERSGIAIVVCVKDEGAYIGEWVLFHQAVGVRHFIVYDNGSTDDTCAILRQTLSPDALTIVPWAGRMTYGEDERFLDCQVVAFAHAILNFGGAFRRMAFIDADEFLLPKKGTTIEGVLVPTQNFPNISLPWHMFGTNGHKTKPEGPVLLNYTKRSADPLGRREHSTNFKCIVDPCEVVEVSIHQFKTREFGDLTVNDGGHRFTRRGRKSAAFYSNQFLQLNHYYSKSEEEVQAKIQRGSNFATSREKLEAKIRTTIANIEADEIEDHAMSEFVIHSAIELTVDDRGQDRVVARPR